MASPPYKISSNSTSRFKSYTHLRSLNIRRVGVIDDAFNVITSIQNVIQVHQSVEKLNPLQKLNVRHFGIIEATGLCSVE
jgi:hypothetical protein